MMNGEVKYTVCSYNIKTWIPVQSNLITSPHLIIIAFVLAATQTHFLFYFIL